MDADRIRNLRPDLIDTIDLLAGKAIRESSDADRIRQALRNTIGLTLDDPEADEDQEVLRAAAAAYADWLDGPTDEMVERALDIIALEGFTERSRRLVVALEGFTERSRRLVVEGVWEAVFQARKETDRG